jgi:hypothetical protein
VHAPVYVYFTAAMTRAMYALHYDLHYSLRITFLTLKAITLITSLRVVDDKYIVFSEAENTLLTYLLYKSNILFSA